MATGTQGTTARYYATSQTHYLRKVINYTDASAVTVGIVPAGCVILDVRVVVTTAFNAATTNTLGVGDAGGASTLAAAVALGTPGVILSTTLATAAAARTNPTADSTITATYTQSGTAATAGSCVVIVQYAVL